MFGKMKIVLMVAALFAVSFVYAKPGDGDEVSPIYEYCLLEDGNSVFGGIFTEFFNGTTTGCIPFSEPIEDYIELGSNVYSVSGYDGLLAVGFYDRFELYDVTNPFYPELIYVKNVYGPVSDMVTHGSVLYIATENGVSSLDLDTGNFIHKHTYGTTKALRIHEWACCY